MAIPTPKTKRPAPLPDTPSQRVLGEEGACLTARRWVGRRTIKYCWNWLAETAPASWPDAAEGWVDWWIGVKFPEEVAEDAFRLMYPVGPYTVKLLQRTAQKVTRKWTWEGELRSKQRKGAK